MARRKHTPGQILAKLRDADVMQAEALSMAEFAKRLEVSKQTCHRWRNTCGGMKGPEMKRLKELEKENARLKRMVAEQARDNRVLRDIAEGIFQAPATMRRAVSNLAREHDMSERRACHLVEQHRSTQRRKAQIPDDEARILADMRELAAKHPPSATAPSTSSCFARAGT